MVEELVSRTGCPKKIPVCFLHFAYLRPLNSIMISNPPPPPPGVGGVGVGEGVGQWDTMSKYFGLLSSILCHSKALNRTKFKPPPSLWGGGWGGSGGRWEVGGVVVAKTRRENSN